MNSHLCDGYQIQYEMKDHYIFNVNSFQEKGKILSNQIRNHVKLNYLNHLNLVNEIRKKFPHYIHTYV